jgi:hypothetical protein
MTQINDMEQETVCRYIRKYGASCSLNNKCIYPECQEPLDFLARQAQELDMGYEDDTK